ncbi:dipeptide transporter; membrane component of ABC superfamily [[Clostridium] ultunense Esp]|uniref:Oligopeptide ABC transporter (Permease) n=1 Tax=[Clostridium] ultunense Esp TaxID=1288971 RepID=M1ZIW7_9FIRM|nr:ABC transporter permease [Schnuerera ultunensis]CCQ98579.1 dipeptide transporter; membrane component of ABC superfamily [[Clostridium] ultunense Esp]SHD78556.1 oligopeptide ABC transporter (permease) [[Clostridium] ultunense Esp]
MKQYIIRRLLLMIPVFIGISIITFALIHSTPGDPYIMMIDGNLNVEDREMMLREIGYYDSIPVKYIKWVSRAVRGDLGYSIRYREPVTDVMLRRIGNTLLLSFSALLISSIIAIPLGIISATKQYSIFDYIATVIALIGVSIPAFFFALGLIKTLAVDLKLFPISGIETIGVNLTGFKKVLDILHHMALPLIVLTFMQTASLMRYTRSAMLEVLQQDYIRTARAKGLPEKAVIYKHALRNAMISISTLITISLGYLLSGAVLTETVFVWPGMGTLLYQAVSNRDYPLITSGTLLIALCVLFANLLSDILYAVIDPRIRYD